MVSPVKVIQDGAAVSSARVRLETFGRQDEKSLTQTGVTVLLYDETKV